MSDRRLIGSLVAARIFGVDRNTFNKWVAADQVPVAFTMPGKTGARLYDAETIIDLAARRAQATTDTAGLTDDVTVETA